MAEQAAAKGIKSLGSKAGSAMHLTGKREHGEGA